MARRKAKDASEAAVEQVDADGVVQPPPADPEREKKWAQHTKEVDKLLNEVDDFFKKEGGDSVVQRLSAAATVSHVDSWVSTGSTVVDTVLIGGRPKDGKQSLIPYGRQTEISGMPGTGKTSLCAQLAAQVQAMGGIVAISDTEERIDHPYWRALGVDTDRIINLTAHTFQEVFTNQRKFIRSVEEKARKHKIPILVLWDSIGGTITDTILDEDDDDIMEAAAKAMMSEAKVIAAGMKIINPFVARAKVAYVYTNTLYTKPNVKYGDPQETPGGEKKNFYATVRLRLKKVGEIADRDDEAGKKTVYGHRIKVTTVKNSMAPNLMSIEGAVLGGRGFSNEYTVKEVAERMGFISTKGAWTTWTMKEGEETKFQGLEGWFEATKKFPAAYAQLAQVVAESL